MDYYVMLSCWRSGDSGDSGDLAAAGSSSSSSSSASPEGKTSKAKAKANPKSKPDPKPKLPPPYQLVLKSATLGERQLATFNSIAGTFFTNDDCKSFSFPRSRVSMIDDASCGDCLGWNTKVASLMTKATETALAANAAKPSAELNATKLQWGVIQSTINQIVNSSSRSNSITQANYFVTAILFLYAALVMLYCDDDKLTSISVVDNVMRNDFLATLLFQVRSGDACCQRVVGDTTLCLVWY
jgi:hypothetical protein